MTTNADKTVAADNESGVDTRAMGKALGIVSEMSELLAQRALIDRKLAAGFARIRGITTPEAAPKRTVRPVAKAGGAGLTSKVFDFLQNNPSTTYNAREISAAVKYKGDQQMVWAVLNSLMDAGKVSRPTRGRYQVAKGAVAQ